ncbi:MAG: hypothetical protein HY010_09060 [Acidobacteria bacterium]|nr:hypothetical protein [Acidobacteriota bacterium]
MLKISTINKPSERRLLVEGKLIQPWVGELSRTWRDANAHLDGRKLVIDLTNATVIGREGEDELLKLMREGAKFSCCGVLTRYVLKQLSHKCRGHFAVKAKQPVE